MSHFHEHSEYIGQYKICETSVSLFRRLTCSVIDYSDCKTC